MSLQEFGLDEVVGRATVNQRIKDFNAMFPLSVENGGTGATSVLQARKNLGVYAPEWLGDSTTGTLSLCKSINQYSFVKITYGLTNSVSYSEYRYYSTASATFSVDVLSSTSHNSLSIEVDRGYCYGQNYLIFASALVSVSASGYTLSLGRNTAFIVDRDTGQHYVAPVDNGNYEKIDPKIKILEVYGYK